MFSWAAQPRQVDECRDLIQRARQGDRSAFAELFDLYVDRVYEYIAYQVDGQTDLAEAVTEQVFEDALQGLRTRRHDEPFSAWLYRLAARRLRLRLTSESPLRATC
jgi:RNA polymerase sigma-70 factor (ECF subfamily)